MATHEIIIDGEVYTVTEDEFGHIVKELKMTPAQLAIMEAEREAQIDLANAKNQAFIDNLPSWQVVDTAVTNIVNLADAKAFIRKLSIVVYWMARNKAT